MNPRIKTYSLRTSTDRETLAPLIPRGWMNGTELDGEWLLINHENTAMLAFSHGKSDPTIVSGSMHHPIGINSGVYRPASVRAWFFPKSQDVLIEIVNYGEVAPVPLHVKNYLEAVLY